MIFCENEAFVLQGGGSEVDEKAFGESRGFEVVDNLGFFASREGLEGFQFDDYVAETNEVRFVSRLQGLIPIANRQLAFAFERDRCRFELHLQSFLINSLEKAMPQLGVNPHGCTNDCVSGGITVRRFRRFTQIEI